ncbi:MAG: DUF1499 domain-containing protein [Pseudomonadota bacterium]
MLNDITTDLADPPDFALAAGGPPAFDARTIAEHAREYPDLTPLILPSVPVEEAYRRVFASVQDHGWKVRVTDAALGRVEAVATTNILRFRDDIAIRIRADGDGSRIDMRSRSRLGKSDFGTNARRIHAFLKAVAAA